MEKRLYRDEYHKKIGGVCAGLAEYFGVDVSVIRLIFVLSCIFHGGGGLVYIVLWIALPKRPYPFFNPTVDYRVPPENAGPANSPYGSPYPQPPYPPQRRSASLVSIIIGIVLIVIGGSILLDNFDIIPDWDIERLWPVALIVVGCLLMLSHDRSKPMPPGDWSQSEPGSAPPEPAPPAEDKAPE